MNDQQEMIRIYGIKQCDTCRKALKWLDEQKIAHDWTDLRQDGLNKATVTKWLNQLGPERLINRRSTTWRQLDPEHRPEPDSPEWLSVLLEHPTLIKRPVFEINHVVEVGFNDKVRDWLSS